MQAIKHAYRIIKAAALRAISRRFGFQTIGTGEYLRLNAATHYTLSRADAFAWANCYPSAVIVSKGEIVASFINSQE